MPTETVVTYLVANYNCASFLEDCIRSLQTQTVPNWKCIICDDRSTDESKRILSTLTDSRFQVIFSDKNKGYTRTLQHLIQNATSEWVAIFDPDDQLYPHTTEKIRDVILNDPGLKFIYSKFHIYDAQLQNILGEGGTPYPSRGTTLESGFISHIKVFKKSEYLMLEGYDPEILYAEDRDLIYQFEEITRPRFIDEYLYKYRVLTTSQSNAPQKKEIGLQSHYKARKKTLKRRNIKGMEYYFYCMLFKLDTIHSSDLRPKWQKQIALKLRKKLVKIDKRFKVRKILYN